MSVFGVSLSVSKNELVKFELSLYHLCHCTYDAQCAHSGNGATSIL